MAEILQERMSPAKINLWLKVTGKRSDGYHELETLFMPLVRPGDTISLKIQPDVSGISISSTDSGLPCDAGNICWKAAELYFDAAGVTAGVAIHIDKQVPVAAGLGGGSANAAAVLLALQQHFKKLSKERLAEVAVKIGADVPFFLDNLPAMAEGVGEKLCPVDFDYRKLPLVIAAPDFPVSAAWAYRHLDPGRIGPKAGLQEMLDTLKNCDWEKCGALLHNDLAFALYEKFPILTMLKNVLLETGAFGAEVSGSGPTMFAICSDHAAAARLAEQINDRFEGKIRTFASGD